MDYVLGIDSGGTNFRIMAGDCQGNVLGSYTGRPANHYCVPEKEIKQIVNQSLDACLAQVGGRREDCRYLVVGTPGRRIPAQSLRADPGVELPAVYHE